MILNINFLKPNYQMYFDNKFNTISSINNSDINKISLEELKNIVFIFQDILYHLWLNRLNKINTFKEYGNNYIFQNNIIKIKQHLSIDKETKENIKNSIFFNKIFIFDNKDFYHDLDKTIFSDNKNDFYFLLKYFDRRIIQLLDKIIFEDKLIKETNNAS